MRIGDASKGVYISTEARSHTSQGWACFDPESGLASYAIGLGTQKGVNDLIAPRNLSLLELPDGMHDLRFL